MKKFRNIVRAVLFESFFKESALRIDSLSDSTALFILEINQGYEFVLYDPFEKNVYATITISKIDNTSHYYVSGVAAEKGFGPFIYELAMMHLSKESSGLMPARDGDVRGDAWNVWKKFYNRNDVDKKMLDLFDDEFRCDIITGDECYFYDENDKLEWFNEFSDDDKKVLKIFNSVYSLSSSSQYRDLLLRANNFKNKGFDTQEAADAGEILWNNAYL